MRVLYLMAAGGRKGILRVNKKRRGEGKGRNRLTVDENARVVMSKLSNEPQILTPDRPISHPDPSHSIWPCILHDNTLSLQININ
jgi:hypothetical protein